MLIARVSLRAGPTFNPSRPSTSRSQTFNPHRPTLRALSIDFVDVQPLQTSNVATARPAANLVPPDDTTAILPPSQGRLRHLNESHRVLPRQQCGRATPKLTRGSRFGGQERKRGRGRERGRALRPL